jgi:hypothetical protein
MMSYRQRLPLNPRIAFSDALLAALSGRHYTLTSDMESALAALGLGDSGIPSHKATLMKLPAELKLEIFDYLLRPGDVYIRWNARSAHHDIRFAHILEDWDSDSISNTWLPLLRANAPEPPRSPTHCETQLFLVSKQLRDEAMHYYLTKNTFHIMGTDCALPYLS